MKTVRSAAVVLLIAALLLPLISACGREPEATLPPATEPPPAATDTPLPEPTALPTASPEPTLTPTTEPTPTPAASFRGAPCPFDLPAGQEEGETVECGFLTVPEDRSDPESPTIDLAVAIFHPGGEPEPDPIIYLEGGPGGSGLELIQYTFSTLFEPVLAAGRDLIVFDQRGVGFSEPALECPGMRELNLELLDEEIDGERVSDEDALAMIMDEALACREDLGEEAELEDYHTAASAADVEDLRLALGFDEVNLWGTSYGTWLALEVMRRYPEGIRSVVLDSVYPPDVDLLAETPTNAARSIDLLFEACEADEGCNSAYPDLRDVYVDTVERLNAEPASFEITNPLTGDSYDLLMTGDNLAALLFQFLYGTEIIPVLPRILVDASQGTYTDIARLMGSLLATGQAVSSGQQITVLCHDEIAFGSEERFEQAIAEHPELERAFQDSILGEVGVQLCAQWQVGQADDTLTEAVTSDLPTLVMSGEFDPVTPPAWGERVAATLANGHFFEYPGVGHGASAVAGCPQEMMLAFLEDPSAAPDDACIEAMEDWQFVVPGGEAAIELVPFESETFGIQGVVPEGWTEAQPGVYARGTSAVDAAVLLEQAAPATEAQMLDLLTQQLGLGTSPESTGQREANGLTWSLYAAEVQGLAIDFALAEGDGKTLLVLLQSSPEEREALYEAVFLPAVDALVPME